MPVSQSIGTRLPREAQRVFHAPIPGLRTQIAIAQQFLAPFPTYMDSLKETVGAHIDTVFARDE
jgi:hypothetical protein